MQLPSGRDGRRCAGGVLPPVDFSQPLGHIRPFRIQRARLLKGGGRVGELPAAKQVFPCVKASNARVCGDLSADGCGLIGVRQ